MKKIIQGLLLAFITSVCVGCDQLNPAEEYTYLLFDNNYHLFFNVTPTHLSKRFGYIFAADLESKFDLEYVDVDIDLTVKIRVSLDIEDNEYNPAFVQYHYTEYDMHYSGSGKNNLFSDTFTQYLDYPTKSVYLDGVTVNHVSGTVITTTHVNLSPQRQVVTNVRKNQTTYNELNDQLTTFSLNMMTAPTISFETSRANHAYRGYSYEMTYFQDEMIHIRSDPFYLENDSKNNHYIIHEENDQLIHYKIPTYKVSNQFKVTRSILGTMSQFDELIDLNSILKTYTGEDEDNINLEKILVEKIGNQYKLSGLFKDWVSHEAYLSYSNYYRDAGIDSSFLDRTYFEAFISIGESSLEVETIVDMPITQSTITSIKTISKTKINFDEFETIDLTNPIFYIKIPYEIDNVIDLIRTNEEIIIYENPQNHYFKVYLATGSYFFDTDIERLKLTIYDSNKQVVNQEPFLGTTYYEKSHLGRVFSVQNGYYYIKVNSSISLTQYRFLIDKLPYDRIYTLSNPQIVTQGKNTIILQGENDIVTINYVSNLPGSITVTCDANTNLMAYYSRVGYGIKPFALTTGQTFPVQPGNNIFHLTDNLGIYDVNIQFNLFG